MPSAIILIRSAFSPLCAGCFQHFLCKCAQHYPNFYCCSTFEPQQYHEGCSICHGCKLLVLKQCYSYQSLSRLSAATVVLTETCNTSCARSWTDAALGTLLLVGAFLGLGAVQGRLVTGNLQPCWSRFHPCIAASHGFRACQAPGTSRLSRQPAALTRPFAT